ncbi:MAG: hypothetical protein RMJ43_00885 [Chloroherpetonaceae bacterium]|nr:hypothetical protein [Chthonomonadaceae bacterium]MDW8206363.1 hypothetical protein [Chloroherpetonaceae bacterium]
MFQSVRRSRYHLPMHVFPCAVLLPGALCIASTVCTAKPEPIIGIFDPQYHDGTRLAMGRGDRHGRLPPLPAGQTVARRLLIYNDTSRGSRLQVRIAPTLHLSPAEKRKLPPIVTTLTVPPGSKQVFAATLRVPQVPHNSGLELVLTLHKAGRERFRDSLFFVVVPPGRAGTTVTFEGRDDHTQGNWVGAYGTQAFMVPVRLGRSVYQTPGVMLRRGSGLERRVDAPIEDDYARQQMMLNLENAETTDDPRVALRGPGLTERSPAAFTTDGVPMLIRVDTSDGDPRRLSLYFLDYHRQGKAQEVSVYDLHGHRLDTRRIAGYQNGAYLRYRFTGSIVVRIVALDGQPPTLSGVFVDPAGSPPHRAAR